jgi:hypothetical protein
MILSESNKKKLIEIAKAYGYRVGIYAVMVGSALALNNLQLLDIPPYLTIGIGFALGEIHSWAEIRYNLQDQVANAFRTAGKGIARAARR